MTDPKEPKSTAGPSGTIVDWAIRFSFIGHPKPRWGAGLKIPIRNVTLRISESTDSGEDGLREVWRVDGVDTRSHIIQPVLDTLDVKKIYALELSLPEGDMYRSSGPAGPHSGRSNFEEIPPLKADETLDYQLRPIRFWLVLEDIPAGPPGRKRIREISNEPQGQLQPRPPPGLATLVAANDLAVNHVEVDWRPDWLRRVRAESPGTKKMVTCIVPGKYKIRGGVPTHIVLHNTGGYTGEPPVRVGPALDKFTSDWHKNEPSHHGIHYLIDYDGHVLKMCPEHRGMGHSDVSYWRGTKSLNFCSVGIEHAHHKLDTDFPKVQRRASLDLVEQLQAAFKIEGRNIVGHGEVMVIEDGTYGPILGRDKLVSCPGPQFYWPHFSKRGVIPDHEAVALGDWKATAYSGFFAPDDDDDGSASPNRLRAGDSDRARRWGGKIHKSDVPYANIIRELHEDMRTIGYFIAKGKHNGNDADFTNHLGRAIKAFKARYLAPTDIHPNSIDEKVDHVIAKLIKQVAAVSQGTTP